MNTDVPRLGSGTLDMAADAAGLSNEQLKARNIRKESGVSYITLDSGRRIKFQAVYVSSDDLARDTRIHPLNLRNQQLLTAEFCDDIIPSIKKAGVRMPVLATRDQDDKTYLIFDGSRRRFSALLVGQGLQINYTNDPLSESEIIELSHVANLTKKSSYFDKGKYYSLQMHLLGCSLNELAEKEGVPKSTISYALTAYDIPLEIYALFPSKTALGRKIVGGLSVLLDEVDDECFNKIKEFCKNNVGQFSENNEALAALMQISASVHSVNTLDKNLTKRQLPNNYQYKIREMDVIQKKNSITLRVPNGFDFAEFETMLRKMYPEN